MKVQVLYFSAICLLFMGLFGSMRPNNSKATSILMPTGIQEKPVFKDPPGTIDGAKNPELIPEAVAYELLFLKLSRRTSGRIPDADRIAALAEKIGLSEDEMLRVRNVADEFKLRVSPLDEETKTLKDNHWPDPDPQILSRLQTLQIEKETIISDIISSLPTKISMATMSTLSQFVNGKMKQGIKLHEGPPTLPSGKSYPKKHH